MRSNVYMGGCRNKKSFRESIHTPGGSSFIMIFFLINYQTIPKVYYNFIQNIIHRPFFGHLARTYACTHTHTDRSTNAYNKTLLILRGVVREKKPSR